MAQSPGEDRAKPPSASGGSGPLRVRALVQDLDTAELVAAFLESRLRLAPATLRNNRWALMRLADAHTTLPLGLPTLLNFMRTEARYLNGVSQQTRWDILRVFYAWTRGQSHTVPALPHVFFGRRRRGERRGQKRRA